MDERQTLKITKIFTDRVQAGVLSQSVGNDLQSLSEGLEAVGVSSGESVSVLHQLPGVHYEVTYRL